MFKMKMVKLSRSIKNRVRAGKIIRSLLSSGYQKVVASESFGLYVLRHNNGNEFVVKLSRDAKELRVTKNNKLIEL